jgi:hypothetical protein
MKIHEVVPLDKNLKRKMLDYCRENKIRGNIIYLGRYDPNLRSALCDKYNNGKMFAGLAVQTYCIKYAPDWSGTMPSTDYFAYYLYFDNKSIVPKPAKPKKSNVTVAPNSLEQRVAQLEAKLAKLIDALRSVAISNNP